MEKLISLTFDDGPNTEITPRVLDLLAEYGIKASFFLIGASITPESARVARRAWEMGCEIENHSVRHDPMGSMTPEEIRREIDGCTEKIVEITGEKPRFFRPPYINVSPTLFDTVELICICGVGCRDWEPQVTARERIDLVMSQVRDGDLILLHDMAGNDNTVEAIRFLIPELKKQGYRFLTCSQIFAENGVTPRRGILYSNVFQTA
jgi:peptidoglycan/xylan/chitin deacetylase (PgdA/CDA1 family)